MDLQLAGKTALVTGPTAGFADITDEEWLRMLDINVMSGVRLSSHYFPRMLARMIEADEIAAMVALLASPPGAASNGAAVRVEGGTFRSIL